MATDRNRTAAVILGAVPILACVQAVPVFPIVHKSGLLIDCQKEVAAIVLQLIGTGKPLSVEIPGGIPEPKPGDLVRPDAADELQLIRAAGKAVKKSRFYEIARHMPRE